MSSESGRYRIRGRRLADGGNLGPALPGLQDDRGLWRRSRGSGEHRQRDRAQALGTSGLRRHQHGRADGRDAPRLGGDGRYRARPSRLRDDLHRRRGGRGGRLRSGLRVADLLGLCAGSTPRLAPPRLDLYMGPPARGRGARGRGAHHPVGLRLGAPGRHGRGRALLFNVYPLRGVIRVRRDERDSDRGEWGLLPPRLL